jgi:hypothetical protein
MCWWTGVGKRRGRDPLLIAVLAELGAGRISEDFITSQTPGAVIHGLIEGQHISINPMHSVVDTVLHECLHRARPEMSELAVRRRTAKFMRCLTDVEIQSIYDIYQRASKKVKRRGRRSI